LYKYAASPREQRHVLGERRRGTTICPACWPMGTKEMKWCSERQNTVAWTGPTRAAKAGQKSLVPAQLKNVVNFMGIIQDFQKQCFILGRH
jgi:hypothetical protein